MDASSLHTIVRRCNCTGPDGIQIHLSRAATAFVVALLDRNNENLWKGQSEEDKKLIEMIGRCLALDIKVAITKNIPVERMDEELAQQKREEAEEPPFLVMTLDELLATAGEILGMKDKLN